MMKTMFGLRCGVGASAARNQSGETSSRSGRNTSVRGIVGFLVFVEVPGKVAVIQRRVRGGSDTTLQIPE
jgi:hypothetical protein